MGRLETAPWRMKQRRRHTAALGRYKDVTVRVVHVASEDTWGGAELAVSLIGAGSLQQDLSARVVAAGLTGRVVFLGEVPDATGYLRQFDLLALPSRHEGLPLVLLEAAASDVPVVAFDVGGVREVLGQGGPGARLVPPADQDAFRRAIEESLQHREQSRAGAVRWAESVRTEFSLAAVSSAYCELYRSAASLTGQPIP